MTSWLKGKRILCVRLDNMGDLLMSAPAMEALRETYQCKISVLTSSMAAGIAKYIPAIDEVIIYDVPWVKTDHATDSKSVQDIVSVISKKNFDVAVIFTVFSQNPLPAAMLAYMANIPIRLAYCRENPYHLLTHWVPEEEPYTFIRHQVRRDLDLVKCIGAKIKDESISINIPHSCWTGVTEKLIEQGFNPEKPWVLLHAGVSEKKREYPKQMWIEAGKNLVKSLHQQVVLTGSAKEQPLVEEIRDGIGTQAFSLAGLISISDFICTVAQAPLVISVNTATIHIAAATHTPVVVLYACTNPQHAPWKVPGKVLLFDVPERDRSKNQVLKYVREKCFPQYIPMISPDDIVTAASALLNETHAGKSTIAEVITLNE